MTNLFTLTLSLTLYLWQPNLEANTWSSEETVNADTGRNAAYLNDKEKEALLYLNLARLYPKKFNRLEVKNYLGTKKYGDYLKLSRYKKSLIMVLEAALPTKALVPDEYMTQNAKCFAKESGERGITGHHRIRCKKENYAECCSYGMETGKDVIMQLLIDHGVPSLGHRKICLDPDYSSVGLGYDRHTKWDECFVLVLRR